MKKFLLAGVAASSLLFAPLAAFAEPAPSDAAPPAAAQPQSTLPDEMPDAPTPPAANDPAAQPSATPASPAQMQSQQRMADACRTREATVYFGTNSANLSSDAENAVEQAAQNASACRIEHVTLTGFTDQRGSAEYNRVLAERRTQAVREILVARGVPADAIQIEAKGETESTGDAARDRRVEVDIELAQAIAEPADTPS